MSARDDVRAKWKLDNARRASAKRAWENANDRGQCACGRQMSVGSRRHGYAQCAVCARAAQRSARLERAEQIAALWADGLPSAEIAKRVDMTVGHLGVEIVHIRRNGWARVPYRKARKSTDRIAP